MGGMITHSGRIVRLDVDVGEKITPPSIPDIGLALARVPRFGGHTRRWWTVAHHVLWLEDYAKSLGANEAIRLGILLHDAHEAVTGDIPTHFKTPDMKSQQRELDRAIFGRYFPGFYAIEEAVKYYDCIGLLAEADIVGPPALEYSEADDIQSWRAAELFSKHFPGLPDTDHSSEYLRQWLDERGAEHGGMVGLAAEFVDRVVKLL